MTSHEILMKYADGLLSLPERIAVRKALLQDPILFEELEQYLGTRASLGSTYAPLLDLPAREAWLKLIEQGEVARPAARRAAGGQVPRKPFALADWWERLRGPALIAGPAVAGAAVALLAVWMLRPPAIVNELIEGIARSPSFQMALEGTPSGTSFVLNEHRPWSIRPTYSFQDKSGSWCRRYDVEHAPHLISTGFACRTRDGGWKVGAHSAAYAHTGMTGGRYAPAARAVLVNVDRAEEDRLTGEQVTGDAEIRRIREGWKARQ